MKKILIFLLAMLMLAAFAACGQHQPTIPGNDPTTNAAAPTGDFDPAHPTSGDGSTVATDPTHVHHYTPVITKEPTCSAKGEKTLSCTCGDSYTEAIATLEHSYTSAVTAPTCTEDGFTTYSCSCGDTYTNNQTAAIGHSYIETVTAAPSCAAEGEKTFDCACGNSYTEAIAALEHRYDSVVTEPTTTQQGYTTHTCSDCGNSYVDSYTDIITVIASGTCGENLFWELDSVGTLTISGTGDMADYEMETGGPWFDYRNQIKMILIEEGVGTIGKYAFAWCSPSCITIPGSVSSIGEQSFYYCKQLTGITIPGGVSFIGSGAFAGCLALESIEVVPENTVYHSANNCIVETATKTLIAGCKSSVIPDDGSVTCIGESAFEYCRSLTSITIPDSITVINDYAFNRCSGLTNITIPSSVTSISSYFVFTGCSGLERMEVAPGNPVYHSSNNCIIETASKTLIAGCNNSMIPDDGSVTEIGYVAFKGCTDLTSLTIPDSITSVYIGAFSGCTNLIQVENGVSYVDNWVVDFDNRVAQPVLRKDTRGIAVHTFASDPNLTSITLPASVLYFGSTVFSSCTNLTSITFEGTVEQWNAITKDSSWDYNTGAYTVYCTNGTIPKA